jgi:hypothetical protein
VIPNAWHFQFKVGFRVSGAMVLVRWLRCSHLNAALCAFKVQGKCESSEQILSTIFCDYRLILADKEA